MEAYRQDRDSDRRVSLIYWKFLMYSVVVDLTGSRAFMPVINPEPGSVYIPLYDFLIIRLCFGIKNGKGFG